MLTGNVHKQKYVYYRCSSYRGKCDLPRFRERDFSERLGNSSWFQDKLPLIEGECMGARSLRNAACHEAGHAVIAHRNGFVLRRIVLWREPSIDRWHGLVDYEPKNWTCPGCGKSISSAISAASFASLDEACVHCAEQKLGYVQRCLAGGASTEVLECDDHEVDDSGLDREEAFKLSPKDLVSRRNNYSDWMESIKQAVTDSAQTIQALRDRLIECVGQNSQFEMSGEEATAAILGRADG